MKTYTTEQLLALDGDKVIELNESDWNRWYDAMALHFEAEGVKGVVGAYKFWPQEEEEKPSLMDELKAFAGFRRPQAS